MSLTQTCPLNSYFSMKEKLRKIRIFFDTENWLCKSEIGIFQSLDLKRTLIYQIFFNEKVLFHSIKLPFDAEVAEKNLKCYLLLKLSLVLKKSAKYLFPNFPNRIINGKNLNNISR